MKPIAPWVWWAMAAPRVAASPTRVLAAAISANAPMSRPPVRDTASAAASAAAPATGLLKRHLKEQIDLVNAALTYEE